jgi:glutamate/tyrosine decarboxylase-like PLP-dependent enzyme
MPTVPAGLPEQGMAADQIYRELDRRRIDPIRGHWSHSFRGPPDVQEVGRTAFLRFMADNGIFSVRLPYMQQIEQEVIAMCVSLFHPQPDSTGNFTSGGSESNYSALHAIREWAREQRPQVRRPTVVAPYSAHGTFTKGCHYFGLELIRTPLGKDYRADVAAMAAAITPDTVALVGSAPCWPYGLFDPLPAISALASQHGLWMHVDACVGGYLSPFAEQLGVPLPEWDFRLPAVQSISADLHKLGYCPKPASTVLWRSAELQRYHYVNPTDIPTGEYRTAGFAGSRNAGAIFAAWAVLKYLGHSGYLRLARQVLDTKQRLIEGIRAIDGLEPFASDLLPLPFGATDVALADVVGEMTRRGYILLGCKDPPLVDMPIDPAADDTVIDTFLADLRESVTVARANRAARGDLAY